MDTTRQRGERAESRALRHLQRAGLRLVERNYRCPRGEIDLIMRHGGTLVFVEVRSRASARHGGAAASVDWRKQQRLLRSAAHYLQAHGIEPACRFDVVAIVGDALEWLTDAFRA